MARTRSLAQVNQNILVEIYNKFSDNTFKRSDITIKHSFGPLYNSGHLKKRGDAITLTMEGIRYAKKLISYGAEESNNGV